MIERKHPDAKCEECPLYAAACAKTIGPKNAKIAVVSRSPGKYEAQQGKPFSGPSGKVLDHLLKQNGVKREEALLTNVVLCCTDDPPKEAIAACSLRLHGELHNSETIIAAGSEAASAIAGVGSISGNRGYVHKRFNSTGNEQSVIVTNNPAVVLKNDKAYVDLVKDFRLAINPKPVPTLPEINWTNDLKVAKGWLEEILELDPPLLACDIEAGGLEHWQWLASIAFSASGEKAVSFGYNVVNDEKILHQYIKPILESKDTEYLWHNGKFDIKNLRHKGINARVDEDTLLMSYALDEHSDEAVHSLDYLLMDELGWPNYTPYVVKKWKSKPTKEVPDDLYEYNGMDAAGSYQLYKPFEERIAAENLVAPYRKLLIAGSEALVTVELAGMNYDVVRAADMLEEEMWPKLDELREHLRWVVGDGTYNPNSAPQNSKLVYDKWCLIPQVAERQGKERSVDKPVYKAIHRGEFVIRGVSASTDEILEFEDLQEMHELLMRWGGLLADFKSLDKQRSTYLEGLIPIAEQNGGRIFTGLNLHGTSSGRLSSRKPNLQNITRIKAGLPDIRKLFTASPGRQIVNADYSQAELRCIAKFSGDPKLTKIYTDKVSLHKQVAERFYGPDYTYEQYVNAKNMDFGVAYGQSAMTFKEKHDVPVAEGEQFIKWWKREFPDVFAYAKEVGRDAVEKGVVISPFCRRRRFYLITKENINEIKREAWNFLPQSTASDFTLSSVIILVEELNPAWGSIVLTVHDSILGDIHDNYITETAQLFKEVMEAQPKDQLKWDFPFEAEVSVGPTWGEVKEIEI